VFRPDHILQVLVDALDRSQRFADDLMLLTCTRLLRLAPHLVDQAASSGTAWPSDAQPDGPTKIGVLAQGLATLLTEAFLVVVERSGRALVPELIAERADANLRLREGGEVPPADPFMADHAPSGTGGVPAGRGRQQLPAASRWNRPSSSTIDIAGRARRPYADGVGSGGGRFRRRLPVGRIGNGHSDGQRCGPVHHTTRTDVTGWSCTSIDAGVLDPASLPGRPAGQGCRIESFTIEAGTNATWRSRWRGL